MDSNGEKEGPQREVRLKPALLPQKSASIKARSSGETSRSVYRSNDLPKAQGAMPKQARPSDAPSLPNQSQPVQMDSNQNSRQTVRPLYPSSPLQQAQGAIRKQFQPKGALPYPDSSPSVKRDSNQNSRETSSLYPSLQEAQRPTQKPTTEDRMLCPYCNRKVKKINLDCHLALCLKVRHPCVYCNEEISKEEITSHVAICESNPDSVHKQKPEKLESHVGLCKKNPDNIREQVPVKSKEAPITLGTRPSQASCGKTSIYEDVAPPRMPAGRSTGTRATPHSVNEMTTEGDADNTRFSPNGTSEIEVRKVPVLQRAFSKGPLPCVYCGKVFTKEGIEVDKWEKKTPLSLKHYALFAKCSGNFEHIC